MSKSEKPAGPNAFVTEAYNAGTPEELQRFVVQVLEEEEGPTGAVNVGSDARNIPS